MTRLRYLLLMFFLEGERSSDTIREFLGEEGGKLNFQGREGRVGGERGGKQVTRVYC